MNGHQLAQLCDIVAASPSVAWETAALKSGCGHYMTFINPYSVHVAKRVPSYLDDLKAMDEVLSDGMLMSAAATRITGRSTGRFSFDGNSIAPAVFDFCDKHGLSVALIGSKEGVAQRAAEVILGAYPRISFPITRNGYFSSDSDIVAAIALIKSINTNVVIVGMGAPYQERFLRRLQQAKFEGAAFTCGGYLDQLGTGNIHYYPFLVEKLNLRAPYRLAMEPRRLSRRYFLDYCDFYFGVLDIFLSWLKARLAVSEPKNEGN